MDLIKLKKFLTIILFIEIYEYINILIYIFLY